MGWKMASPTDGTDLEASLLSFEKLDRASPDLWPEQLPGVAEFAASFKSPITSSPPKWMAEIERDDIDMLKELGSLTTANLMEKVRGLQNLAYQLGLDESMERSRSLVHLDREATGCCVPRLAGYGAHCWNSSNQGYFLLQSLWPECVPWLQLPHDDCSEPSATACLCNG
ncbi:protein lin-52 homolog isoform X2 [Manis pentadactyla]|uniref:protein lin-52 homolog isoform X2 n=1 Tax=Manis pentadactyla TaxID=143292 RepID=UPI00255C45A9|nr:protein lin-52 homolog isoform X2 [Manis pentadactyla]